LAIAGVLILLAFVAAGISYLPPLSCPDIGDTCSVQVYLVFPFSAMAWWLGSLGIFAVILGSILLWRYGPWRRVPPSPEW